MRDLLGAGFYHLLLGILIATFLGRVGSGIGKSWLAAQNAPDSPAISDWTGFGWA